MFYIDLESPAPIPSQILNKHELQGTGSGGKLSPQPPPRSRHNPFNKPTSGYQCKEMALFRKTFKELHNQLGRPILRDRNEWRFGLIKQESNNQEPLIHF